MLDRHYNFLLPLFIITGILSAEDPELTLRAAIDSALEHNLDLRIALTHQWTRLTRLRSKKLSSTHHSLRASLQERKSAARSSALDDLIVPESENSRAQAGANNFSTGATVTLDSSTSRRYSNNNAARNQTTAAMWVY